VEAGVNKEIAPECTTGNVYKSGPESPLSTG